MPGVGGYETAFAEIEPALKKAGPAWLHALRREGMERFRALGFPSLREEDWRFTRTRPISELDFRLPAAAPTVDEATLRARTFDDTGCVRIVLVNGRVDWAASRIGKLPDGVRIESLAEAFSRNGERIRVLLNHGVEIERQRFAALNTAFFTDGVYVEFPADCVFETPIHVVHVAVAGNDPVMLHPRLVVNAARGSQAKVVESYIATGDGPYFTNAVSEIACGENASLQHRKIQNEGIRAFHVAIQHAKIAGNARFATLNVSFGGALVRNDVHAVLDGEGIDARIDGLYLADGRQHVDNHTFIRHAKPHCHSYELYKGILAGHARGVFNGRINVDPDAQKTDAKQQNNCILLSDDARINSNPQLEIFADDVKCTHGAAVGKTDDEALFYLRSRGIRGDEARDLLVYAFASELFERIEIEPLKTRLEDDLFAWLERSRAPQAA
jgi:Fe-S cluster assembly protein SufD